MKKMLNIQELQNSEWPKRLQEAFGDNLISAFLHGNCLMEGFDALRSPWTVSFILKKNGPAEITAIQDLSKLAQRENIKFCYFFSPVEIATSLDTFPLEYLHISNRNVVLCGIQPLAGYIPDNGAFRLQCERELRGALIHLRQDAANAKLFTRETTTEYSKAAEIFKHDANLAMLPTLYGVYFLKTGNYPEKHQDVFDMYPNLSQGDINNYIDTVNGIVNEVDSMEEK